MFEKDYVVIYFPRQPNAVTMHIHSQHHVYELDNKSQKKQNKKKDGTESVYKVIKTNNSQESSSFLHDKRPLVFPRMPNMMPKESAPCSPPHLLSRYAQLLGLSHLKVDISVVLVL